LTACTVFSTSVTSPAGAKGAASSDGLKYATMEAQESASKAAALEKQVEKLHVRLEYDRDPISL